MSEPEHLSYSKCGVFRIPHMTNRPLETAYTIIFSYFIITVITNFYLFIYLIFFCRKWAEEIINGKRKEWVI